MTPDKHMLEALREFSKQRCDKKNCGTVCLCGPCHARKALEHYEPKPLDQKINIIPAPPTGWWFMDARSNNWCGPIPTFEQAQGLGTDLSPDTARELHMMYVQDVAKTVVILKRYDPCTCKTGFKDHNVCRKCEGTGRILRP